MAVRDQSAEADAATPRWLLAAVFVVVTAADLLLVAKAGTDVPFMDQWTVQGRHLFPAAVDGTLRVRDLYQSFNEHRIFWTQLLDLALFKLNGQWDPLLEMTATGLLRGGCATLVAAILGRSFRGRVRWAIAGAVTLAFLPHLAWHVALWGIESHSAFVLGFSLLALILLAPERRSWRRTAGGLAAGVAALFAMGPGAFVGPALLGLALVRAIERRRIDRGVLATCWPAAGLLVLALLLRERSPELAGLQSADGIHFMRAAGEMLAWPAANPIAALAMNLPLAVVVGRRISRRRTAAGGEDTVLCVAGWSVAVGLAAAWARGGSAEFIGGVPSRYVDFMVGLPLANLWSCAVLAREWPRPSARVMAAGWIALLAVSWAALSTEAMTRLVLPRARDREGPVRVMRALQVHRDASLVTGQPKLYVPNPELGVVFAVLDDPRLSGKLPPSLQPQEPTGPLSRAMRKVVGWSNE